MKHNKIIKARTEISWNFWIHTVVYDVLVFVSSDLLNADMDNLFETAIMGDDLFVFFSCWKWFFASNKCYVD